jgi:hypothetical protein
MARQISFIFAAAMFFVCCLPVAKSHDFKSAEEIVYFFDKLKLVPPAEQRIVDETATANTKPLEGVLDTIKIWRAGQQLNVCFFSIGVPEETDLRAFFAQSAKIWSDTANIHFDFGQAPNFRSCSLSAPSDIRVTFQDVRNWSYVGTDSRAIAPQFPTLAIGEALRGPFASLDKDRLRGVILHELGHALGLQHEHQSPDSHCEEVFNWPVIYQAMARQGWGQTKVNFNMRRLYASPQLMVTNYDPLSIMHYALPAQFFSRTDTPCFLPHENNNLSATDKTLIAETYPQDTTKQAALLEARQEQVLSKIKDSRSDAKLTEAQIKEFSNVAKQIVDRAGITATFKLNTVAVHNSACSNQITEVSNSTITIGNQTCAH